MKSDKTLNENSNVLNERELPDNYPVYCDFLYVCDGKIIKSDIQGTVRDLKRDLREYYKLDAIIIKNCDTEGRRKINY